MKQLFAIILIFACAYSVWGQSKAKFNPKVGFAAYRLLDEVDLDKGLSHTTQFFGFDMVLQKNKGVFIPGFHYSKFALAASDFELGRLYDDVQYAHYVRMPISFGYSFAAFKLLEIMPYGGGNATFFLKVDENDLGVRIDNYNGVQAAMQFGVQFKALNHITLDVAYDHSFSQRIKTRQDSKVRGWIFSAGFTF